jgi:hypothetical protein
MLCHPHYVKELLSSTNIRTFLEKPKRINIYQ